MAFCEPCDRKFKDAQALKQHLNSPLGAGHPRCERCHKTFNSEESKLKHLVDSPKHNVCTDCPDVLDFATQHKLNRHATEVHGKAPIPGSPPTPTGKGEKRKKKKKNQEKGGQDGQTPQWNTPLDLFFLSFPGYEYNPHLPPATSYRNLERHFDWKRDSEDSKTVWGEYLQALQEEVKVWYGKEDDLTAWHTLCRATGHTTPPSTISKCRSLLRKTHVNIIDLIHWRRSGSHDHDSVKVFESMAELRKYTLKSKKIFPLNEVEGHEEGNIVLRHLLRRLFNEKSLVSWG